MREDIKRLAKQTTSEQFTRGNKEFTVLTFVAPDMRYPGSNIVLAEVYFRGKLKSYQYAGWCEGEYETNYTLHNCRSIALLDAIRKVKYA